MKFPFTSITLASLAAGFCATAAMAAPEPTGVWIDHTGRGAVEISQCGGGLCGHVVWVKDSKNSKACRTQIIGNAQPVGAGTWDRGWIVDPDDDKRYSVELKPVGEDRLRVMGYMGSKLFSETMMWKRAPADLKRCDVQATTTPAPVPVSAPLSEPVQAPVSAPVAVPYPAPQREASAPATVAPAAPAPAPSYRLEPEAAPAAPEAQTEIVSPAPRQRQAGTKAKAKECKLELPYITVQIPCDAFK